MSTINPEDNMDDVQEQNGIQEKEIPFPSYQDKLKKIITPQGEESEQEFQSINMKSSIEQEQEEYERQQNSLPCYCRDDVPEKIGDKIKWHLLHGWAEEDLENSGYNEHSIRAAAEQLEKEGLRERPPKPKKRAIQKITTDEETSLISKPGSKLTKRGETALRVFQKGSPAEALLATMVLPDQCSEDFASGVKFGASMLIMGVRIGQDLAGSAIQLAKPLIEISKSMREGEIMAAETAANTAATQAADQAAGQVMTEVAPYINKLKELLESHEEEKTTPIQETNEMKKMMLDVMKPMVKQITKKMNKAMTGIDAEEKEGPPDGWTVE